MQRKTPILMAGSTTHTHLWVGLGKGQHCVPHGRVVGGLLLAQRAQHRRSCLGQVVLRAAETGRSSCQTGSLHFGQQNPVDRAGRGQLRRGTLCEDLRSGSLRLALRCLLQTADKAATQGEVAAGSVAHATRRAAHRALVSVEAVN